MKRLSLLLPILFLVGCGGSCGDCDPGMTCNPDGQCVQACDLPAIDSDRTLDVDLRTFFLSGTVTLNGATMPDEPAGYRRADIAFVEVRTGDSSTGTTTGWVAFRTQ